MTVPDRRCTGPLRLGVPAELVPALRADDRVVWLDGTPVVTPVRHLPWWSHAFLTRSGLAGADDARYCDWDAVSQAGPAAVVQPPPAPRGPGAASLWVTEVPDDLIAEADAVVASLAAGMGLRSRPVRLLDGQDAVEEHFTVQLRIQRPTDRELDLRAAWDDLVLTGGARDGDPDGPSLLTPGHPVDRDALWGLYSSTMALLSQDHPIEAALQRDEFESFATSPRDVMLVMCSGGEPVSLALIATSLSQFSWLDPRWTDRLLVPGSPQNLALIPGIATRVDRQMVGSIAELLHLFGLLVLGASTDVTLLFPCNNVSREYTPRITQKAIDRFGDRLWGRVGSAAAYVLRGYVVDTEG